MYKTNLDLDQTELNKWIRRNKQFRGETGFTSNRRMNKDNKAFNNKISSWKSAK